ncbi:hypothetical protein IE53DRAFT_361419 [Violaceomyces palustris]|uniref:Uncharacterized protein n=1 Tax=Violaceomyces palustris TaxID=1673888 RepID=A0ACD0P0L2_9BASI|nr:hypothetical protein IE53DRAFT_361419 [Violaceomyces palustris]
MFRPLIAKAAPFVGASALFVSGSSAIHAEEEKKSQERLSIYPNEDPKLKVVEVHTELERQIGSLRRSLSDVSKDARESVKGGVDKWISIEKGIENEVKSVIPSDEPLTPGILYVGVATLAGSVFTRFRSFPIRLVAPPLMMVGSLQYFLPKTSSNLAQYYDRFEQAKFPQLHASRVSAVERIRHSLASSIQTAQQAKSDAERGLKKSLSEVENVTGLKVGQVVGEGKAV